MPRIKKLSVAEVKSQCSDLLRAGGMLANCAFNLKQSTKALTDSQKLSLAESQRAWDAAENKFRAFLDAK